MSDVEHESHDLLWHLEQAVSEPDLDAIGLGHNMASATLEQLHEIVEFAERMKLGALAEMWGREREAEGIDSALLELPPGAIRDGARLNS